MEWPAIFAVLCGFAMAKLQVGPALTLSNKRARKGRRFLIEAARRLTAVQKVSSVRCGRSNARARRIGQNAAAVLARRVGHNRWLWPPQPHDVEHTLSRRQQIIRDDPPVAAPPDALCTHDGAGTPACECAQAIEAALERLALGVVCVVVEAFVLPKSICSRRHVSLSATQAAEFGDMLVCDAMSRQCLRQNIEVELRIRARAGNCTNVNEQRRARRAQERHELINRLVGMSNRKECRTASGHVEARCLCAWRRDRSCHS